MYESNVEKQFCLRHWRRGKIILGVNRHQCRKTIVLSCHRCVINTGVEKRTTFKYRVELGPPDVSM